MVLVLVGRSFQHEIHDKHTIILLTSIIKGFNSLSDCHIFMYPTMDQILLSSNFAINGAVLLLTLNRIITITIMIENKIVAIIGLVLV